MSVLNECIPKIVKQNIMDEFHLKINWLIPWQKKQG